jgi:hypothetical protein
LDKLRNGELLDIEAVVVSKEEAVEARSLAKAHGLTGNIALLVHDVKDEGSLPEGAATVWAPTDAGVRRMWTLSLCDGAFCKASGQQPKVVTLNADEVKKQCGVEQVAFRVTIAKEFVEKEYADIRASPADYLQRAFLDKREVHMYGWKEVDVKGLTRTTGFIRVAKGEAAEISRSSGKAGVFAAMLGGMEADDRKGTFVEWVAKYDEEDDKHYFERALRLAVQEKLPLAFRQGGGSALGLRRVGQKEVETERFAIFGVPENWGPVAVEKFLEIAKWRSVRGLKAPRFRSQGWLFTAATPAGDQEDSFVYPVDDSFVTVRRWWAKPPTVTCKERMAGSTWIRPDSEPGVVQHGAPKVVEQDAEMEQAEGDAASSARPTEQTGVIRNRNGALPLPRELNAQAELEGSAAKKRRAEEAAAAGSTPSASSMPSGPEGVVL